MQYEFSKADKKLVRQIIETGLQREFGNGLSKFAKLINDWEAKGTDNSETYYKLYKAVVNFDKHIGRRYDNMSGSKYNLIVASQFYDVIITENDLIGLSEEAKSTIMRTAEIFREL